ncbi:HIT domain-containing protein [Spongiibacter nanhainus]|uniref:HIT domain-containing protein n=1 Tax=Spongiibacter nanhainus TaxID=2794344 RepID=A0A7T4UPE6_9GAMM|nr:HIT domain-containing protein [Spongiibacter nanhainus]QQD17583.1 HIT domain-containing protein [Spongiibacter nanhainus]
MFELHSALERDCQRVGQLPLCDVLLMDERHYPWLILVPRVAGAKELIDLSASDERQFWQESRWASEVLQAIHQPDKLNVAALGNMVPQLHIHHIARFTTDAAWPKPVWGAVPAKAYDAGVLVQEASVVADHFAQRCSDFVSALL